MQVSRLSELCPDTSRTEMVDQRSIAHLHVKGGIDSIRNEKKDDLSSEVSIYPWSDRHGMTDKCSRPCLIPIPVVLGIFIGRRDEGSLLFVCAIIHIHLSDGDSIQKDVEESPNEHGPPSVRARFQRNVSGSRIISTELVTVNAKYSHELRSCSLRHGSDGMSRQECRGC